MNQHGHSKGLVLRSALCVSYRVRRLRRYESCFTGTDAVAWLTSNDKAATPEEAVMLGNDMLRAGLLHHVSFKRPFQDKDSLYRCGMLHVLHEASHCAIMACTDPARAHAQNNDASCCCS